MGDLQDFRVASTMDSNKPSVPASLASSPKSYMSDAIMPNPPPMWARTDLDAFLLFEAANRNLLPVYSSEPPLEERNRLTASGSVIIWDESASEPGPNGKKLRWNHTLPWSHSRMVRSYLVSIRLSLSATLILLLYNQTYAVSFVVALDLSTDLSETNHEDGAGTAPTRGRR